MTDKERELFTQALNLITELDKDGLVLEMGLILEMREALAQPEQEPIKFLANGVRYKVTHQGYYGCSIVGLPENLNGQWVALVEATDSKHLNCIPPQELAKPEQTKCPRCGEANPAEIHTCSPQVAQPEQEHQPWCDYLNIMLTSLPPKRAECNCKQAEPERKRLPPKPWVGLTDEEMKQTCYEAWSFDPYVIAQAIQEKLRSKNEH